MAKAHRLVSTISDKFGYFLAYPSVIRGKLWLSFVFLLYNLYELTNYKSFFAVKIK